MDRWDFLKINIPKYLENPYIAEIVICDENGNDASKIISTFNDSKIRVYKNNTCLGAFYNKQKVVSLAECEFVCLMDSDNFAPVSYFDAIIRHLGNNSLDSNTVYMPSKTIPQPNHKGFNFVKFSGYDITLKNIKDEFNKYPTLFNTGNYVVSKELYEKSKLSSDKVNLGNECMALDVLLQNYLFFKNNKKTIMRLIEDMEYDHIVHPGSYWMATQNNVNVTKFNNLYHELSDNMIYNLTVCSVFKNEAHILDEWIQHYKMRGVDHIYLVNDFSTDNYASILNRYKEYITLFNNDIVTNSVGRQCLIYEKYFRPILNTSKWVSILDMDEFLYSPSGSSFDSILEKYKDVSQIRIDWLHFGSNGHLYQPISVVNGFTKRSPLDKTKSFYSYKNIFKTKDLISFNVHLNSVSGTTHVIDYKEGEPVELVINHYTIQSLEFFMRVKATRGDINNWFDHEGLKRDKAYFDRYDVNELEDLRLYEQNKTVQLLGTISNNNDVTLVITSCNRPHLLKRTLSSFVQMNTYPICKTYIIDDSGLQGCNDTVIEEFKDYLNITSIYNNINLGQVQSIDKVYSYVRSKYIFHCEEDWVFLKPGFIEKSMKIFNDNPAQKIYTVWLRPHNSTSGHPIIQDTFNRGYYMMKPDFSYIDKGIKYTWGGITFNPGLRKTEDCLLHHPYSLSCDKMIAHGKEYVGEYTINKKYVDSGYFAYILDDPSGHVDHIGWNEHIPRFWD